MKIAQWSMKSKIGTLYLVASNKGLQGIFWQKQDIPMVKTQLLSKVVSQLKEYFAGKRKKFNIPLDTTGTTFQKAVWNQLSQIPYGETTSYKEVANRIKNPKAVRAVGTANGKNPLCVIVPCHRVISHNGTLGGYSGGLEIKKKLLKLERARWVK